jgi:hypothetical protein
MAGDMAAKSGDTITNGKWVAHVGGYDTWFDAGNEEKVAVESLAAAGLGTTTL